MQHGESLLQHLVSQVPEGPLPREGQAGQVGEGGGDPVVQCVEVRVSPEHRALLFPLPAGVPTADQDPVDRVRLGGGHGTHSLAHRPATVHLGAQDGRQRNLLLLLLLLLVVVVMLASSPGPNATLRGVSAVAQPEVV